MATSEEEKRIAKAYNVGTMLSTYEPKLLVQIIKTSKDNEFVKTMAVAKDHNDLSKAFHARISPRNIKTVFTMPIP